MGCFFQALCNMMLVMGVMFGQLVKKIFLGTLRDPEVEVRIEVPVIALHYSMQVLRCPCDAFSR